MTEQSMLFRQVLGAFATGVAVVTTKRQNCYFGLTINSFTSVSLDPMLIQINIAKNTTSHEYISETGYFAVNILAEDQLHISNIFSGAPPAERFRHVQVWESGSGSPVIEEDQVSFLQKRFYLIGILSEYIPYAQTSGNKTPGQINTEFLNSDYSVVTPIDKVLELISKFDAGK